jgi:hypothetical protein
MGARGGAPKGPMTMQICIVSDSPFVEKAELAGFRRCKLHRLAIPETEK